MDTTGTFANSSAITRDPLSQAVPPIEVSTVFFPAAVHSATLGDAPDIIIMSRDNVFFYCRQSLLRQKSTNMFGQVLPSASSSTPPFVTTWSIPVGQSTWDGTMSSPSTTASVWIAQTVPQQRGSTFIAYVDEPSEVLNIILHIVYETPVAHHGPSLNLIDQALSRLSKYGIQAPPVNRGSDVWTLLLNFGHRDPVRVYAIAASHAIEPICIAASELTLKVALDVVTEEDALKMGAVFLRRLLFLHLGRQQALKRIILEPPMAHKASQTCSIADRQLIEQRWSLGVADLIVQDASHNTPVDALIGAFGPVVNSSRCDVCRENIRERITQVMKDWDGIRRTI
ncbi:hypothetical protein FRB94_005661 [Tulasnella sp. JGI-2019a]|nr:hypothetical protein FRB94_005661 [Tulasnella sp. JGI-2019a]KAG9007243.1 hypothetical protein FRB93_008066 [Tulasnella sp. JGI-2019a]